MLSRRAAVGRLLAVAAECSGVFSVSLRALSMWSILVYINYFRRGVWMVRRRSDSDPAEGARAKLFWNGRSQAVRLPKAFRFEGDEVSVRREGDAVILEPVRKRTWLPGYWERLRELTRDFDFPDVEPLGGRLLDVRLDDP